MSFHPQHLYDKRDLLESGYIHDNNNHDPNNSPRGISKGASIMLKGTPLAFIKDNELLNSLAKRMLHSKNYKIFYISMAGLSFFCLVIVKCYN